MHFFAAKLIGFVYLAHLSRIRKKRFTIFYREALYSTVVHSHLCLKYGPIKLALCCFSLASFALLSKLRGWKPDLKLKHFGKMSNVFETC